MRKTNKEYLESVLPFFPKAFIHPNGKELILEPKNNVYFRLDNVSSDLEFDCKMLEYLVRPAHKGVTNYWENYFKRGLSSWFRKNWSREELSEIYTYIGCGVNREKCIRFIESEFDLSVLKIRRTT